MLRLDHVVFPVRDARATLAFYRDLLGLPLSAAVTGDDWGGFPWLMMIFGLGEGRELVTVALRGAPAQAESGLPRDVRHYAFAAESAADLDGWRGRLSRAGVDGWEEAHADRQSLYFADPDGVILEITWPPAAAGAATDPAAEARAQDWIAKTESRAPA